MKLMRKWGVESERESYTGADCTGANNATGRVLTLANIALSKDELIAVGGMILTPDVDYTISHATTGTTVTFIGIIQNLQNIEVLYFHD